MVSHQWPNIGRYRFAVVDQAADLKRPGHLEAVIFPQASGIVIAKALKMVSPKLK